MLRFTVFALLCAAGAHAGPLLFRAGLSKGTAADYAAGDPQPLVAEHVEFSGAAVLPPTAKLTYDARGNMYAEQGTLAFWWRPDGAPGRMGFPIFYCSYEQHGSWDFTFARIDWTGSGLSARVRDRNMDFHTVNAAFKPVVGRWTHLAITWSEAAGVTFYIDGRPVGSAPGPLQLDAGLDQFGLLTDAVTPHHTHGGENPGSIRDLRVYRAPLTPAAVTAVKDGREIPEAPRAAPAWSARFGWDPASGIPAGEAFRVRRVPVREAFDLKKLWLKATDGKRDTLWPTFLEGYSGEGKGITIYPASGPVNYLRTAGNLKGRITGSGGVSLARSGAGEIKWYALPKPGIVKQLAIQRETGVLGELSLMNVERSLSPAPGPWVSFAPSPDTTFQQRRDPAAFTVWKPGKPGETAPAGPRYHYFVVPVQAETGIRGVRLRVASEPGQFYYAAVEDPVNTVRDLIEAEFRAVGRSLELELEFPHVIVPAGKALVLRLASSAPRAPRVAAQLIASPLTDSRPRHAEERIWQIRDSFQMLCEARPWMQIGRGMSLAALRRQLKLVDELYTLLEDIRRVEPGHPLAAAYWGWMNRMEPPPAFTQPKPADPSTPLWAFRQLLLIRQFRQVTDWWIDNRQIENGELGGDINDDTDLIQNWPGVALLDGPSDRYRKSIRAVAEASHNLKRITDGFNTERMDALHAYEEGINTYGPAFLLDYGNPTLAERMMRTARHYFRIMGVNRAGHRHFRSIQYSFNDVVEEGYYAREARYSHLILQPGLYLAWYNGAPPMKKLLAEYADTLLDHWKTERYPNLARTIFFPDDRVETRDVPFTDVWNIFWGLWEITGDQRYLWPLRAAVEAGDISGASGSNGRWIDLFPASDLAPKLAAEVQARSVTGHNLQTDQLGTVARVLAWQNSGNLALVEEAQAALVQHMAQNMYLYTDAQQFDDRIWIPTLATQRERLGGVANNRNCIYPGHAVSWEETGGEVGLLVPSSGSRSLRITAFNTGAGPRRVRGRVWKLEHGRYEVTVKDAGGATLSTATLTLKRYSPFEFVAPPRQEVTVEFRQLSVLRPLTEMADLGIAPEDVRPTAGLELTVHNIGAVASKPFRATVQDAAGKVIGEAKGPALPAPDDLLPKTTVVRIPVEPRPGLRITVSQESGDPEICDENNELRLP